MPALVGHHQGVTLEIPPLPAATVLVVEVDVNCAILYGVFGADGRSRAVVQARRASPCAPLPTTTELDIMGREVGALMT